MENHLPRGGGTGLSSEQEALRSNCHMPLTTPLFFLCEGDDIIFKKKKKVGGGKGNILYTLTVSTNLKGVGNVHAGPRTANVQQFILFLRENWDFISLRRKGEKFIPIWKEMKVSIN